jgi:ABC-type uncharacterized transport system substrate-binding protein
MGPVGRRRFLVAAGAALAAPLASRARTRRAVIGLLVPLVRPKDLGAYVKSNPFYPALLGRLRELGWSEGSALEIVYEYPGPSIPALEDGAKRLVARKVDVVLALSPQAAIAAVRATRTIPIVFWGVGFPVEIGLVESLSRPRGNATGLAWFADEAIYLKRVQLFTEITPGARRLGWLQGPGGLPTVSGAAADLSSFRKAMDSGVQRLGIELQLVSWNDENSFVPALAALEKWGPDSLGVADVPMTRRLELQIFAFAQRKRLPDIYERAYWADHGGLASYGFVILPTIRRIAEMTDQVLRGAKPADIPVELPSQYELVINLKRARSIGLEVPQAVLARADRVVE